jgi:ABC-type transporter Mla subunit MlaD
MMERLRRLIANAGEAMRHAAENLTHSRKTLKERRELEDELAHRSKRLDKRVDELEKLLVERPEREAELRVKIEEVKADRGDVRDKRRRLRRVIFPELRDRIKTWRQRRKALSERREALREKYERAQAEANEPPASGVTTFDGKQVAAWFVPWLNKIRARGRWSGVVVSGWRDPVYSEQLCLNMCGQKSCPGTCAGRASHHSGSVYPAGAIDVSDYYVFAEEARAVGAPFYNALPNDRVHFSTTGN